MGWRPSRAKRTENITQVAAQWGNLTGSFGIILVVTLLLTGCPNKFSQPGSDGGQLPADFTDSPWVEYSKNSLQGRLSCGQPYKITVTVQQPGAACDGFNYRELYRRAAGLSGGWVLDNPLFFNCPQGCDPLHSWWSLMRWSCDETVGAVVSLQRTHLCPRETDEKPEGLSAPPVEAFNGPFQAPAGTQPQEFNQAEEVIHVRQEPPPECPSRKLYRYDYNETVPNCREVTDFEPFVRRAELRAGQFTYSLTRCPVNCISLPFSVYRRSWACGGNQVTVSIYFYMGCQERGG